MVVTYSILGEMPGVVLFYILYYYYPTLYGHNMYLFIHLQAEQ